MKKFLVGSFVAISLLFIACDGHMHGDEGDYDVMITINEPTVDQNITAEEALNVDVSFAREDEKTIHNIFIEVRDADGNSVEILDEGHKHETGEYRYVGADWTPDNSGTYTLFVETTDDEGMNAINEIAEFTVNE